jgi:hypothetical protein
MIQIDSPHRADGEGILGEKQKCRFGTNITAGLYSRSPRQAYSGLRAFCGRKLLHAPPHRNQMYPPIRYFADSNSGPSAQP